MPVRFLVTCNCLFHIIIHNLLYLILYKITIFVAKWLDVIYGLRRKVISQINPIHLILVINYAR